MAELVAAGARLLVSGGRNLLQDYSSMGVRLIPRPLVRHLLQDYNSMGSLVDSFMDVPVSVAEYEYGEADAADSEMDQTATEHMMSDDLNTAAASTTAATNTHSLLLLGGVVAGMALMAKVGYPLMKRALNRSRMHEEGGLAPAAAHYGTFAAEADALEAVPL